MILESQITIRAANTLSSTALPFTPKFAGPIHREVLLKAGPSGELVYDEIPPGKDPVAHIKSLGGFLNPTCPACWKIRKPKSEKQAETQQYIEWAQPYNSPETAKRLEELEEEYQRRAKAK